MKELRSGLLARYYYWWYDGLRRYVDAYDGPDYGRLGVLGTPIKKSKKKTKGD